MVNVLILGANGQLARNTAKFFLARTDARLTLYLHRARRLENPDPRRVRIVEGDVLDPRTLQDAMRGQDVVYANLAGAMERSRGLLPAVGGVRRPQEKDLMACGRGASRQGAHRWRPAPSSCRKPSRWRSLRSTP
jgi:hypothetical protein